MLEIREPTTFRIVAGDTSPKPTLVVRGIEADPSGATAKFSLLDLSDAAAIDEQAATVSGVASYTDRGATRWQLTVTYSWSAVETAALSGSYYGRFAVTLPASAGIISAPADRRFSVFVFAPVGDAL